MENYHITKGGDGWNLQKEGNVRPSKTAATKREIVDKAHNYLSNKIASLKIHGEDGKIQEERTFQRKDDPRRSAG